MNEIALLSNMNLLPQFTSQIYSEEQRQSEMKDDEEQNSLRNKNIGDQFNENDKLSQGLKLPTQENFDDMKNSFSMEKINNKPLKRKMSPKDTNESSIASKILSNEKINSQYSKKPHLTNGINGNKEDSNGNEAYDDEELDDEEDLDDEDIEEIGILISFKCNIFRNKKFINIKKFNGKKNR